jgi:signal transduction histidine kinase
MAKKKSGRRTSTKKLSHSLVRRATRSGLAVLKKRTRTLLNKVEEYGQSGQMTAMEKHDMNGYVNGIYGQIDLIKMALEKKDFNISEVSKRLNLARRLLRLGYRLMGIAKKPKLKTWQADKLAETILEYPKLYRMMSELDMDKFEVKVSNTAGPRKLEANERWLSRLLLNLTANAGRAMPLKGGSILVNCRTGEKNLVITVADTGRGMTAEQKKKFEVGESFTTKSEDKKNHGLGFHVVRNAVKLHNAKIKIMDNRPQGTVFIIRIPLAG